MQVKKYLCKADVSSVRYGAISKTWQDRDAGMLTTNMDSSSQLIMEEVSLVVKQPVTVKRKVDAINTLTEGVNKNKCNFTEKTINDHDENKQHYSKIQEAEKRKH